MKTEHSIDINPVEEPDSKRSMNSSSTCLTLHRIKVEVKLEPGVEADSNDDQIKMEFQESEMLEEKPDLSNTNFENMDALGLHDEFDIKTESDQSDTHDSASDSAQIKIKWKREQKHPLIEEEKKLFSCYICNYTDNCKQGLIVHIKRNNCYLGSSLGISQSVSRNQYQLNVCIKCDIKFKHKALLDIHMVREHAECIASAPSRMYECTFCDLIFVHESHLTRHMLRHQVSNLHICKHCNSSFKTKRPLFDHILQKHPEFSGTVSCKIHECTHCAFKTTIGTQLTRHMAKHNTRKPFQCMNCDASFRRKQSIDNHILQKHPEMATSVSHKIYECTHCEFKTTYAHQLASHTFKHTGAKFPCAMCDASFIAKRSLDKHNLQKHPELAASVSHKIHECTHYEYKTTRVSHLTTHMVKHTGAKFQCTNCGTSFSSKRSLDNHTLHKHPASAVSVTHKIHECAYCEYKTTHLQQFSIHMMKHAAAKLTYTECDASFTSKQSLDNHISQNHPEFTASPSRKLRKCTHCEYKTTFSNRLVRHINKHTAQLTCTNCDASFTTKRSLDDHILRKHLELTASVSYKIRKCTHCEYKTILARDLARHIMKHTGAKFTCTKCDASFARKESLDNHILQKHPELTASVSRKIHACSHCEYKTTHAHYFACHMTKHTGAKFTCTECDALFTTKRSLDEHILRKHLELTASVSHKIRKCTHCEYKTTSSYMLAKHIRKHTGQPTCTKSEAFHEQ